MALRQGRRVRRGCSAARGEHVEALVAAVVVAVPIEIEEGLQVRQADRSGVRAIQRCTVACARSFLPQVCGCPAREVIGSTPRARSAASKVLVQPPRAPENAVPLSESTWVAHVGFRGSGERGPGRRPVSLAVSWQARTWQEWSSMIWITTAVDPRPVRSRTRRSATARFAAPRSKRRPGRRGRFLDRLIDPAGRVMGPATAGEQYGDSISGHDADRASPNQPVRPRHAGQMSGMSCDSRCVRTDETQQGP